MKTFDTDMRKSINNDEKHRKNVIKNRFRRYENEPLNKKSVEVGNSIIVIKSRRNNSVF